MSSALQFESVDSQSTYIAQELAEDDPRWAAVQRVLTSSCFSKAGRLSSFLSYVCERTLSGQQEDVTEQQIGISVFGREPGFNTGEDTIVRTTARAVRQKLDQYFYVEGQNDPIRIVIPKGTYIPEFQERPNISVVGAPVQPPVAAPVPVRTESPATLPSVYARQVGRLLGTAVVAAIFFACAGLVYWHFFHRLTVDQALWRQLFKSNQPVLFVPGDAGLVMFATAVRRNIPINEYSAGMYKSSVPPGTFSSNREESFTQRRDTGITDLVFATKLASVPQAQGKLNIKFTRDLSVADLRSSNAILLGAPRSNPWVTLFDQELNFHVEMNWGEQSRVINRHPQPGEQPDYLAYNSLAPSSPDYALVALVNGSSPGNQVLLIEGTTTASIDAASNFLLNPNVINNFLRQALRSDGSIRNFEVLISTHNVGNSGAGVSVIATRIY
jgi:hypothetical protein